MASAAIEQAAERLRQAEASGQPCAPIASLLPAGDIAAAYEVQEANTRAALADGRRLVGRKIGLTSASVQAQLGVAQPDYGMLFADMAWDEAGEVPIDAVLQPRVEAEIALVLDRDLPHRRNTIADIIAATAYALPCIEIVGSRIADWKIGIVDTIADNASSGGFVLGASPRRLSDFDPGLCGMVLEVNGQPLSSGAGRACLGGPLNAARWLADVMAGVGRSLCAGDIILTGALGPMMSVKAGDAVQARINGLGSVGFRFGARRRAA
ncbi:2-keto-4-pentenoate hydratase [Sphingomonas laterariae]|uniref:2-keto-4-pentenoate hydratase n=1 Tax=Edaphosphingomonas laterariae TaxID=861865 RepID=A0A239CW00_9SPHN|nr:fumarylacetoacetate hydrolase family protein [Sphingomonas laterariae]SNS24426.1 2-keto-4-pentenoate hydratase [Sphingomonas laterariae]